MSSFRCLWLQVVEIRWEIRSCFLQSRRNSVFASRIICAHLLQNCWVIDGSYLTYLESWSILHRRSCSSLGWLSNLHCIFLKKFPAFQGELWGFNYLFVKLGPESERRVFKQGEIQFPCWIEWYCHRGVRSFFITMIFNHWGVNFRNRKQLLCYFPWSFWRSTHTKFNLSHQIKWNLQL